MPTWVLLSPFCVLVVTKARGARERLPRGKDTDRLNWVSLFAYPLLPRSLLRVTSML
ncbi:hypothetical protein D3C77_614370 [compost metagenome]